MGTVLKGFLLLLLALAWAGRILAGEAARTPETLPLKEQMQGLMQAFQGLEGPLDKKPPEYEAVLKLLDEINARAKIVQSLKIAGHPEKEFKRLFRDLDDFKKSAQAKSHSGMEDGMNRLAESCFRCHLSHK